MYVNDLSKIQTSDLIACRLTAYSFYEKDHFEVPAFISHFSDVDLSGASLRWRTTSGESGQYALPANLRPGSVNELPPIRIVLPATDRPSSERLELELRHRNGNRLAEATAYRAGICVSRIPRIATLPHSLGRPSVMPH